jgi:hypothetical protein
MADKIYWVTINEYRLYPFSNLKEAQAKADELFSQGQKEIGFCTTYNESGKILVSPSENYLKAQQNY